MKFKKFVKSLASSGIIYTRGFDRWLASPSVFMAIPGTIQSVTAAGIQDMPEPINRMISQVGCIEYAELTKAIMPYPDGKIKDCVRVFSTVSKDISIAISNDDWSLIDKSDFCEILYAYDIDSGKAESKALLVKQYPQMPDDDDILVGVIFPCEYAEQLNFHTIKEENNNG